MESKVDQLIVDRKVLTKYDYKSYLINKVAWDMAPVTMFSNDDEEVRQLSIKFKLYAYLGFLF